MWGLGVTQAIDAAATDLFVYYQSYESNSLVGGNAATLAAGASIKF